MAAQAVADAPQSTGTQLHSQLHSCPDMCIGQPENWTVYASFDRLKICKQPVLFDFAVHNPIDDPNRIIKLRTCTAGTANDANASVANRTSAKRSKDTCISSGDENKLTLDVATGGQQDNASNKDIGTILNNVQSYLSNSASCDTTFIAGFFRKAVIGVYSGIAIDNYATASSIIQCLATEASNSGAPKTMLVQLCGKDRNADHTFGVAIDTTGDIAAVQQSVMAWSNATCVIGPSTTSQLKDVSIFERPLPVASNVKTTHSNDTTTPSGVATSHFFVARGDCTTATVVSGDSCGSLASKCGISGSDFTTFNRPKPVLNATGRRASLLFFWNSTRHQAEAQLRWLLRYLQRPGRRHMLCNCREQWLEDVRYQRLQRQDDLGLVRL
jgi:hypothetical protein